MTKKKKCIVFSKSHTSVECNYCYTDLVSEEAVFLPYIVELTTIEISMLEKQHYYVMEVLTIEDVEKALKAAIQQAKEEASREEERKAKNKAAAEKRKKTREENKRKKELAQLQELKDKYEKEK